MHACRSTLEDPTHEPRAVVLESVTLGDQSLELEPGQVVSVVARGPDRLQVRVGHEGAGWLPARALEEIR